MIQATRTSPILIETPTVPFEASLDTVEARPDRVRIAMGPVIGAILIANLITGIVGALFYAMTR